MNPAGWEIECKYRLSDPAAVRRRAAALGAVFVRTEEHVDEYFAHPCRDLRATDEAIRVRRINDARALTYKGPRQAGPAKIREEIECELNRAADAALVTILQRLGFTTARIVRKTRQVWELLAADATVTLAFDSVPELGEFVELEILSDSEHREQAASLVTTLAGLLQVHDLVSQSYLGMLLARDRGTASTP